MPHPHARLLDTVWQYGGCYPKICVNLGFGHQTPFNWGNVSVQNSKYFPIGQLTLPAHRCVTERTDPEIDPCSKLSFLMLIHVINYLRYDYLRLFCRALINRGEDKTLESDWASA
jgi:hypothetical protein